MGEAQCEERGIRGHLGFQWAERNESKFVATGDTKKWRKKWGGLYTAAFQGSRRCWGNYHRMSKSTIRLGVAVSVAAQYHIASRI